MSLKSSGGRPAPAVTATSKAATAVSPEERHEQIAKLAYFMSERRQAAGGLPDELQDWLQAERAIDSALALPRGHIHSPEKT